MPKHKSAIKRLRQSKERRARNRVRKSKMKSAVKRLKAAIGEVQDTDHKRVEGLYRNAVSAIAKTSSKKTIHRNTAARKISRLTKAVKKAIGADVLPGGQPEAKPASVFETESVPEAVVEKPEAAEALGEPTTRGPGQSAESDVPPASQDESETIPEEHAAGEAAPEKQETAPETAAEPNASESEKPAGE
ncbi:MAG: 30S ribosomal protein S20 [Candidatus Coatesbacteria bacterium]|nr:MAG: 30S ribosomal protein S20 [Candidatus Coatesbacteria bacterium]